MLTSILNLNQGGEGGGLSDYDQPLALLRLKVVSEFGITVSY